MRVINLIRTIGIITYLSLFLKQINFDTNTFAFHICFEVKGEHQLLICHQLPEPIQVHQCGGVSLLVLRLTAQPFVLKAFSFPLKYGPSRINEAKKCQHGPPQYFPLNLCAPLVDRIDLHKNHYP